MLTLALLTGPRKERMLLGAAIADDVAVLDVCLSDFCKTSPLSRFRPPPGRSDPTAAKP